MVSGSHNTGFLPHYYDDPEMPAEAAIRDEQVTSLGLPEVAVKAEVGDALFFSSSTVHCGVPNTSDQVRMSLDFRFQAAGQPSVRPFFPSFPANSVTYAEYVKEWMAVKDNILALDLASSRMSEPLMSRAR